MNEFIHVKELADGRSGFVVPLTFGRARIGIGPTNELWFDDVW
jgi:hypothetical protein